MGRQIKRKKVRKEQTKRQREIFREIQKIEGKKGKCQRER